jgi:DNA-binding response OmpR family regulator
MAGETILLVEDNDAVALGLIHALKGEGFQVLRAESVARARKITVEPRFDLIILDIRLPDGSGFDLCGEFRELGIRQPIIMLTAKDEVVDKVIGLEMGADDYLTKPFELRELLARIHSLLRRSYGELAERGDRRITSGGLSLELDSQRVTRGSQEIHLTTTEFKLLTFLIRNPGQAFRREELMEQVWGYPHPGDDARTVDVHVRNLRQKIEPDPTLPRLIVTVRGVGYMYRA